MNYLKIWTSFREVISPLNDAEKGRLLDAMLSYADSGEEPDLKGNERFIWPAAKQDIDRAMQKAETLRANGSRGGRPSGSKPTETNENQTEANGTRENQTKANESHNDKEKEKEKGNVKGYEGVLSEDCGNTWDIPARETPDTLELYALRAFPHMTPNNVSELISYLDSLPEELIRYAVDKTAEQGVTAYSYCRTILNRYVADGIHSVAEAREKDAEYERRRKAQAAKPAPVTENPLDHAKFY